MSEIQHGYHTYEIPKGKFGEVSKIYEELLELEDAEKQGSKIMVLNELSDLIGAVEGYLQANFNDVTLEDVIIMMNLTKRAFESGRRK